LIALGANVAVTAAGCGALHVAACYGKNAIISYLMENTDLDINMVTQKEGVSPFIAAVKYGHVETARHLLGLGANARSTDSKGFYAIHHAKSESMVNYLIKYLKFDINMLSARHELSPIMNATSQSSLNFAFFKFLIKLGANYKDFHREGFSILHRAAIMNVPQIIHYLVTELNIDVNQRTLTDETAFMYACRYNNLASLKTLITLGASLDLFNKEGLSAIHYATTHAQPEVVRYLVEELGVDVNLSDHSVLKRTPLYHVIAKGHFNTFLEVLRLGAALNQPSLLGNYSIHLAAINGNTPVLTYLVEKKGVAINQLSQKKETPFDLAMINNNLTTLHEIVRLYKKYAISLPTHPPDFSFHAEVRSTFAYAAKLNLPMQLALLDGAVKHSDFSLALALYHESKFPLLNETFMHPVNHTIKLLRASLVYIEAQTRAKVLYLVQKQLNLSGSEPWSTWALDLAEAEFGILQKTNALYYEIKAIEKSLPIIAPLAFLHHPERKAATPSVLSGLPTDLYDHTLGFLTPPLMRTSPSHIKTALQQRETMAEEKSCYYKSKVLFFKKLHAVIPGQNHKRKHIESSTPRL